MQLAAVIAFSGFDKIIQADYEYHEPRKKKASSHRGQAVHIFFALYQTAWEFAIRCLDPHLLFKYCPVVLEVKTEQPPYPLHRLYPSTAVLL